MRTMSRAPWLLLVLAGCGGGPQSALDAHGPAAEHLRGLILWVAGICALVWVLVMVVLIWALARARRAAGPPAAEGRIARAVGAGVAVTAVVIAGFTLASFRVTRALGDRAGGDVTVVVRGQQWWWQLRYLDDDGGPAFDTANEIHVPVGADVRLLLESADVIHSFWVPEPRRQAGPDSRPRQRAHHPRRPPRRLPRPVRRVLRPAARHMALARRRRGTGGLRALARGAGRGLPPPRRRGKPGPGEAVFLTQPVRRLPHDPRHRRRRHDRPRPHPRRGAARRSPRALLENTRGALAAWIADPQTVKPGNNMPTVPLTADELRRRHRLPGEPAMTAAARPADAIAADEAPHGSPRPGRRRPASGARSPPSTTRSSAAATS